MVASLRTPQLAALALLAVCAWLGWAGRVPSARPADTPPVADRLGPWVGTALAVEPSAGKLWETDEVSLREYRLGKEPPVWFARVAGFGNRAAFHPPEICYVGSHFEVLERGPLSIIVNGAERRLMRLVIGQGKERFEAWYWFTANDRVTPNYYQQQLWLVMDTIRRKPMSGTLVRILTPLEDAGIARRRLLAFVTALEAPARFHLARHDL